MTASSTVIACLQRGYEFFNAPHPKRTLHQIGNLHIASSQLNYPICNMIYTKHPDEPISREALASALEFFKARQVGCCFWSVGQLAPEKEALLQQLGFIRAFSTIDVIYDLVVGEVPRTAEAKVEAVKDESLDDFFATLSRGFEWPEDIFKYFADVYYNDPSIGVRKFLVRDGAGLPGGAASMVPFKNQHEVILFNGAATLPSARNQGLYQALLRERLRLAKAAGFRWAVIQANTLTSAPIAKRFGFKPVCESGVYFWNYV